MRERILASFRGTRAVAGARPAAALGAAALGALTACRAADLGLPEPATRQAERAASLWDVFVTVAALVGALVIGGILWSIVRYRSRLEGLPKQTAYHVPAEVIYTTLPLLLVGVLFAISLRVQREVVALHPKPDLVVEVTGFQWSWRFRYPGQDVTLVGQPDRPPELVLLVGATVRFVLTSADVIHSFSVPAFLEKQDAVPGRRVSFDVDVEKAGFYASGRCAEFCGLFHDRMTFTVRALLPEEFEAWAAAAGGRP